LKNLVKDEDRRTRAKKYLEDTLKASKEAGEAQDKDKASTGTNGENGSSTSDPKSQTDGTSSESQAKSEDAGPAEEGELAGDEQVCHSDGLYSEIQAYILTRQTNDGAGRSISPNARSDGRSRADSSQPNGPGMPMMNNNMMQQQNGGNNGYSNMFNGMGNQISPQMQMLQTQITSTMNVLSSNSLPAQMRAQLTGQLQNLQYQYGQMMQMMQMNGAFGGQGNMMQQQMSAQMQQMQQMQQMSAMQQQRMMMMQGNGNFGGFGNGGMPMGMNMMNMNNMNNVANMHMNGAQTYQPKGMSSNAVFSPMNNTTQFTGRHGSQFEADSSDSPYMRVPTNPKFKKGSQKRDRPEDFLELGHQQIRRL
jgi:protein MPE1